MSGGVRHCNGPSNKVGSRKIVTAHEEAKWCIRGKLEHKVWLYQDVGRGQMQKICHMQRSHLLHLSHCPLPQKRGDKSQETQGPGHLRKLDSPHVEGKRPSQINSNRICVHENQQNKDAVEKKEIQHPVKGVSAEIRWVVSGVRALPSR
jgi:hypothetical protein